jgi:hypothetical protein
MVPMRTSALLVLASALLTAPVRAQTVVDLTATDGGFTTQILSVANLWQWTSGTGWSNPGSASFSE